jgi:hypothetical protein
MLKKNSFRNQAAVITSLNPDDRIYKFYLITSEGFLTKAYIHSPIVAAIVFYELNDKY